MHTCKREERLDGETDWVGRKERGKTDCITQDKSDGKPTWTGSEFVSQKTMLLEQHAWEGTAASMKCLQHRDRQYLTAKTQRLTTHDSHPSAKIALNLCLLLCPRHVEAGRVSQCTKCCQSDTLIWNHVSLARVCFCFSLWDPDSSTKWLTIYWSGIWICFLYWLWLKYKHAEVMSAWKGESIK